MCSVQDGPHFASNKKMQKGMRRKGDSGKGIMARNGQSVCIAASRTRKRKESHLRTARRSARNLGHLRSLSPNGKARWRVCLIRIVHAPARCPWCEMQRITWHHPVNPCGPLRGLDKPARTLLRARRPLDILLCPAPYLNHAHRDARIEFFCSF